MKELMGATCFMVVAQAEKKSSKEQISSIQVVEKYVNVFLDKVTGLPPSGDVEFTNDLIPRAGPY